jgi:hypothetical protein
MMRFAWHIDQSYRVDHEKKIPRKECFKTSKTDFERNVCRKSWNAAESILIGVIGIVTLQIMRSLCEARGAARIVIGGVKRKEGLGHKVCELRRELAAPPS